MKRILALILTMVFCYTMVGSPIDETTAKQFAQNFWKENNIMAVRNGKVFKQMPEAARFVNVAPQHGYSAFYIFNNTAGKGYVIMAADDCVTPILGYSYENNFGDGELPPNFKAWLDNYALQIEEATTMKLNASEEIRNDWNCLRQCKTLPIKSEKAVGPLVQTKWNQSPYYNALCPYDSNAGARAVTGCVATAMAQVMKYWSHPAQGFGNHSYVPSSHPEYGTLYVDFSNTNYDYNDKNNNDRDSYNGNNSEEQDGKGKPDWNTSYSNEWRDGRWYNADGTQTYSGTLQWESNATGWWVEDTDGWYPTDSWQKIDNVWYYFKPDGYMASNEYYNGYWFNADGSWDDKYLLSWKQNSTGWWVEDISGWWPQSQWLKIDGSWYYFDASGYMV